MYGYVYITENLINHKRYIGQHKSGVFDEWYKGSGNLILQAIEKYGSDNFTTKILEECCSKEDLDSKEKYWIAYYNAINDPMFYNLNIGGTGGFTSEMARKATQTKINNGTIRNCLSIESLNKRKKTLELNKEKNYEPFHARSLKAHAKLKELNKSFSNPEIHAKTIASKIANGNTGKGSHRSESVRLNISKAATGRVMKGTKYHHICKTCGKSFIGNSSRCKYCEDCNPYR